MSWCPACGSEYREGFERCAECDVELVDRAPERPRIGPEWTSVGVFTTSEEAVLARGLLRGCGLVAEVFDREMHVAPYGMALLGEAELLVPPDQAERARAVLASASTIGRDSDEQEGAEVGEPPEA